MVHVEGTVVAIDGPSLLVRRCDDNHGRGKKSGEGEEEGKACTKEREGANEKEKWGPN